MRKYLNIMLLALAIFLVVPAPSAKAIDPITLAILAPIALKAAEAARPYVIRAGLNLGKGLLKIGKDSIGLLYLPYGLGKILFTSPWGGFRSGVVYTLRGLIAPCKMLLHVLLLPVYMVGVNVNL